MNSLFIYALCVLSSAYITRIMLFGSNGPFESNKKFVVDNGTHEGSVCLFDYVRRVFGAYKVEGAEEGAALWRTTVRMDVFRCPKCLSFWVSFLVSVPFIIYLTVQNPSNVLLFPVLHCATTYLSQFLVFLQLTIEGD